MIKKTMSLLLVSALGGLFTLGFYKIFLETPPVQESTKQEIPTYVPATFSNNNTTPTNANIEGIDFTIAAEKTVNSVVHVKNSTIPTGATSVYDFFYKRDSKPRTQVGTGSGVIVSPDGHIITNNHVIANASQLEVTLNNNKTYQATLVGTDEKTDIALLKIEADEELNYITFGDSDNVKVGEWVLAVGNPFNLTSTVTAGIISAKARDLNEYDAKNQSFLQTDAAVNPGNSGGALVNTHGDLIGINTAITSQTGSYVGYSFAVPSNIAKKVIDDLLEFGDVQKGLLGISALNRNSPDAIKEGLNEIEGVYVSEVTKGSGADKAGIKSGDIIKGLDRIKVRKFADLSGYLGSKRPKDVVKVTVLRDGKTKEFSVSLSGVSIVEVDFIGMKLRNISDKTKERYGIKNGVIVASTKSGSLIRRSTDVTESYILTEIDGQQINSIQDVLKYKNKKGENNISKITFLNRNGEAERYIFGN